MTLWLTFYDGASFEIIDMNDYFVTVKSEYDDIYTVPYDADIIHIGEDDSPEYWEAIKHA